MKIIIRWSDDDWSLDRQPNHSCMTDAKALAIRSAPCWFGCSPDTEGVVGRGEQNRGRSGQNQIK